MTTQRLCRFARCQMNILMFYYQYYFFIPALWGLQLFGGLIFLSFFGGSWWKYDGRMGWWWDLLRGGGGVGRFCAVVAAGQCGVSWAERCERAAWWAHRQALAPAAKHAGTEDVGFVWECGWMTDCVFHRRRHVSSARGFAPDVILANRRRA